ncbi:MAG TPA: hypothetical protein VGY58_14360 [Gemmataceae bacterium]|jgi:hypothetical protein|nr:hypothetical protein [Gemmataceae bacterium]
MYRLLHTAPVLLALGAGLVVGCNEASSPSAKTSPASAPANADEYVLTVEGMV